MRFLTKYEPYIYATMRFVVGILFACHGAQKLFGSFGGQPVGGNTFMLVAGIIEFVGGVLVTLGLWAGPAAFLCSGDQLLRVLARLWLSASHALAASFALLLHGFVSAGSSAAGRSSRKWEATRPTLLAASLCA